MNSGKIRAGLLFVCLVFTLTNIAAAKYSGGSGTHGDPYKIGKAADLLYLETHTGDYDKYFILTADIDLASSSTFTVAVIAHDTDNSNDIFDGTAFTDFNAVDHVTIP